MTRLRLTRLLLAGCVSSAATTAAVAGGFDRGGINIDLLFESSRFAGEVGVTHVSPQRTIKNVDRLPAPPQPDVPTTAEIDVEGDYTVPRIGLKANLFEPVDCLATYTEPYGADTDHGKGNAYSPTAVRFSIDTNDFGLTCSYRMQLGRGFARVIGGLSYQKLEGSLARQSFLAFGNPGLATFDLSDSAWSWRIGGAYEIPEIGLRASLVYSAAYEYESLTGTVDTTGFGPTLIPGLPPSMLNPPLATGIRPISASAEIPQAVELKVQSGIAPGWLAFGSVRWQEWSKLQTIPISGVVSPATRRPSSVSLDPFYRDGWTITGGIGHAFNDHFSGAVSLTWDRGTSTVSGTQTDTWTMAVGGAWTPDDSFELRLGGSVGVLTAGTSSFAGTGDAANRLTYSFDDDLVLAGSIAAKVKF